MLHFLHLLQSSFDAAFPFKFHPYATSYKIAENQIAKHKVQGNCILIDAGREMSSLSFFHLQLSFSPFRMNLYQIVNILLYLRKINLRLLDSNIFFTKVRQWFIEGWGSKEWFRCKELQQNSSMLRVQTDHNFLWQKNYFGGHLLNSSSELVLRLYCTYHLPRIS